MHAQPTSVIAEHCACAHHWGHTVGQALLQVLAQQLLRISGEVFSMTAPGYNLFFGVCLGIMWVQKPFSFLIKLMYTAKFFRCHNVKYYWQAAYGKGHSLLAQHGLPFSSWYRKLIGLSIFAAKIWEAQELQPLAVRLQDERSLAFEASFLQHGFYGNLQPEDEKQSLSAG